LIFQRQRSAFAGAGEYIFKHALLRDVIYETVLLKRRRVYHAQIAAWLESHAGERLDEYLRLIARHYELAGQPDKAIAYLQQAGEGANLVSAYPDAIAALEQALALLPEDDAARRAPLLVELGYAYRQTSSYALAIEHIEEALKLAREVKMPHVEITALNELSWAMMGQGRYAAGLPHLYKALDLAREIGDRRGEALSQRHLADIAYRQGRSEDAARHAQASLALSTEVGDRHGIAYAHRVLGFAALLRDEYEEAVRCHRRSYEAYQEVGDRWGMASCFINMGETRRRQGEPRVAAQHFQKALDIFREIDSPRGTAICVLNLGHAHAALMEDATAQRYLREALDIALDIESYALVLETMGGMALLHARAGRKDRAAELLGVVLAHPALNEEIRTNIQPALTLLRQKFSAARLNAALARGQELDWNAVVAELLA
jgi:tetratricopeptide (TPR) repeat protein